jgi:Tol biopolymer transport system component
LLAGKRAFQAESPVETMNAILATDPPPLSGEYAQVSPVLDRIIQRCMEKEPGRSGNYQAWSMNPDGSELTQGTDLTKQSVNNPNISPDGRYLAVGSSVHVSLIDLTAGELPITRAEELPPINDELRFVGWSWSPDGRRLVGNSAGAGERGGRGVWIYEVDTGEYREVRSVGGGAGWFDDRTITSGAAGGIELLDIETGVEETVTVESRIGGWEFSNDRRWVYYTRTETQGDVSMLDHD